MPTARKWIYAKAFEGDPKPINFRIEEEQISQSLKEGGKYISVHSCTRVICKEYMYITAIYLLNTKVNCTRT